jgi:hypothetical protein
MKCAVLLQAAVMLTHLISFSQQRKEDIYSDFVLYPKRIAMDKDIRERIIAKAFSNPLDSNTEYRYESACLAISQFLYTGPQEQKGFDSLFIHYDSLYYETKRAFLEAVYAAFPRQYIPNINQILEKETNPKLFSMCVAYLCRSDASAENYQFLKLTLAKHFPGADSIKIFSALGKYLAHHLNQVGQKCPDVCELFGYQKILKQKIIYSFQRWNRDYTGLAIIQNADGGFATDDLGQLLIIEQLARSGSDLPYFITNGSTPQGIYSIQGLDVSHDNLIGPTPNIQLLLPFEGKWAKYFHLSNGANEDSLRSYLQLLPLSWRSYEPMMEAWQAGNTGRSEIIAHGTTIDPDCFKSKPFYPCTPTEGCLCAKEIWNTSTGHLLLSDQFNLIHAFQSTPGREGFLFVINVDNQQKPLSRQEVESWVRRFEWSN